MDSRPGYGWRNRECRPCRSAPHKVEWRSGKGKRDAFYFLSSKDFLRRCGGYSFSKPYCWWMEFGFLMLCWICFNFHRGFILLMWAQMYIAGAHLWLSSPVLFFLCYFSLLPPSRFFLFSWLLPQLPKEYLSYYSHFYSSQSKLPKTLTIASFRLGLFYYLFCAMRGVHLARV